MFHFSRKFRAEARLGMGGMGFLEASKEKNLRP